MVRSDDWLQHRALARSNIAAGIQILGQGIAAYGLFRAYVRTTFHQSVQQWGSAHLVSRAQLNAAGWVGFHLNPLSTARQQIKHIVRFINDRSRDTVFVQEKLIKIQQDITKLRDEMQALEHKTLAHIASQTQQTEMKAREHDAVDLRLAIAGLLITAAGIGFGIAA